MAVKTQDQCFRTFGGVRWSNYGDMHCPAEEQAVSRLKAHGVRIRVRAHPRGFRIAFIHPDDLAMAAALEAQPTPDTETST